MTQELKTKLIALLQPIDTEVAEELIDEIVAGERKESLDCKVKVYDDGDTCIWMNIEKTGDIEEMSKLIINAGLKGFENKNAKVVYDEDLVPMLNMIYELAEMIDSGHIQVGPLGLSQDSAKYILEQYRILREQKDAQDKEREKNKDIGPDKEQDNLAPSE